MRDVILTVFLLCFGIGGIVILTDNFQAFTAEGARRYSIEQHPKKLADYQLINQHGDVVQLKDIEQQIRLIDFIYTRCPTVCSLLGSEYAKIQDKLITDKQLDNIALISISFDLFFDDAKALSAYQQRYSQTSKQWYVLVPKSKQDLQRILTDFGVVVIKDEYGGFIHNSAIHISDKQGYLTKIIDWQNSKEVDDVLFTKIN